MKKNLIITALVITGLLGLSFKTLEIKKANTTTEFVYKTSHTKWNDLLKKYVTEKGNVNYKSFNTDSKNLDVYLKELETAIPDKNYSRNETLAYWINAYNAYTVKLIVDNYPKKSIKDIPNAWSKKWITLAKKKYSLEDIEHTILRKMNEPRIHFAINCASVSCPNLINEAYTADKLEKQLEASAKSFINDKTKNTIAADKVEISEIFNWFAGDFKIGKATVIDYLNKYSTVKINKNAKIKYKTYNWNLNE
jgi:Protein of unknown function, DUF547